MANIKLRRVPLLCFIASPQEELEKHHWDTFVDDPPSIAQGGKGVVVAGRAVGDTGGVAPGATTSAAF